MKISNKYEHNDVFKRHWQAFAEDISVKSEFVEKEMKYVSTAVKKWAEAVANDYFSLHERPDVINRMLRVIADNLERLNS